MKRIFPESQERGRAFMREALDLARRGMFSTMPNPRVGCVLVRDGEVVGRGWHGYSGEEHAEIRALHQAGNRAQGAVAYLNLEPCSHEGKTMPCCENLIGAGIVGVSAAIEDPNPLVSGAGFHSLRTAGLQVETGLLAREAGEINRGFIRRMRDKTPWVLCKLAMSLDGRIAMASGESRWITGAVARSRGQQLRTQSCAILTGIGTVLADNPRMTLRPEELPESVRQWEVRKKTLLRVVVDSDLRLPPDAQLLDSSAATLVVCARMDASRCSALQERGAEVLQMPSADGDVDLASLLYHLAVERQCNEIMVEAGSRLVGALASRGYINQYEIHLAPLLLGSAARPAFDMKLQTLAQGLRLEICGISSLGDDWRIDARPPKPS